MKVTKSGSTISNTSATFGSGNQLINFGSEVITYDENGNRLLDSQFKYRWNEADQLVSVTKKDETTPFATYKYDDPVMGVDSDGHAPWLAINAGFAIYDGYKAYKAGKSKAQIAGAVASSFVGLGHVKKASKVLSAAKSVKQYSLLKEHYRQAQKYGKAGYKELQNGKIRYYGEVSLAKSSGVTKGRRVVREWDPITNKKRTWHESVTHSNKVNQIRIMKNGKKVHYRFNNGKYSGKW